MRNGIVSVLCVGVLFVGAFSAYGDTIYACVHNQNGQVRIVDMPGLCHNSEYDLAWGEGNGLEQLVNTLLGRVDAMESAMGIINDAPSVDCMDDMIVQVPMLPLEVYASVTDDGLIQPLVLEWKKVTGPGNVVFSDPSSNITEAWFSEIGEYEISLTAHDGMVDVTDSAVITVIEENDPPFFDFSGGEPYYAQGTYWDSPTRPGTNIECCFTPSGMVFYDDGIPQPATTWYVVAGVGPPLGYDWTGDLNLRIEYPSGTIPTLCAQGYVESNSSPPVDDFDTWWFFEADDGVLSTSVMVWTECRF